MATEVKMPQLGLTMEEGTVDEWVKHEGDEVKKGDVICKIATDKLTNDLEAEEDGVLLKIVAEEGEDIPVQGVIAYIGARGSCGKEIRRGNGRHHRRRPGRIHLCCETGPAGCEGYGH